MQIREGEVEDSGAIARLLTELGYPATEDFVADKIQQQRGQPDSQLWVAVEGDEVLGFIAIHFISQLALPGDFCRITYFCVNSASRGKGVGSALEEKVCAIARERGCDCIEVHCHSRRELAHKFYDRQGYSESPKYLVKRLDQTHQWA
jgi:GNAT superfamily N-acetyltransferase